MKIYLLIVIAFVSNQAIGSVAFPGPKPGKADYQIAANSTEYILNNKIIAVSWKMINGKLMLHSITNKISGKSYLQDSSPIFILEGSTVNKETSTPISDWQIIEEPKPIDLEANLSSPSSGKHFPGKSISAIFKSSGEGITVHWTAELRDDAAYVRTTIKLLSSENSFKEISRIDLLCDIYTENPIQIGKTSGSVVRNDHLFFGVEVPFFDNDIKHGRINSGFDCNLILNDKDSQSFSSVIGVFSKHEFRRSFLHYIERERSRSYKSFLLYNCWFDLGINVSEENMIDRINSIHKELGEKRSVPFASYVVDNGYDDPSKGFWAFNQKKFPNGFTPLAKRLKEINSNLGIWLSPRGGWEFVEERTARAKEEGIPVLDLSNPAYYKWFLNRHLQFINDEQVNYFKWDGLGKSVTGHFMALMDIANKLRNVNPDLFLNATGGTWQSPFWLKYIDSTWRGGSDIGFMGKGDSLEQLITYRDATSYTAISKSDFIYPLTALMNHGIIFSDGHELARAALNGSMDIRNEVRTYFGAGYALQELYIKPNIMEETQWDAIAESAIWANKRADILVDSHFIGGDPNKLEIYGFAAWQHNQGTITLRNPNDVSQTFSLDILSAFELSENVSKNYILETPYKEDQRITHLVTKAGTLVSIELKPFEVLVFDAKYQE